MASIPALVRLAKPSHTYLHSTCPYTYTHNSQLKIVAGNESYLTQLSCASLLSLPALFYIQILTFNTTFEQLQLLPRGPKILDHPLPTNLRRHRAHKDLLPLNLLLPPGVLLQLLLEDLLLLLLRVLSPFLLPLLPERHKFHPL
jgi:hypothetical protein